MHQRFNSAISRGTADAAGAPPQDAPHTGNRALTVTAGVIGVLLLLMIVAPAFGQDGKARLDLGLDAAVRGERASPNVVLSLPGPSNVASIHFEVVFPSRLISFVDIVKGAAAEAAGAELKSRLVTLPEKPGESVLVVDVSGVSAIEQGTWVKLSFDVAKDAPVDQNIPLKAGRVVARSAAGTQIELEVVDGAIAVLSSAPPVISCFFYMH